MAQSSFEQLRILAEQRGFSLCGTTSFTNVQFVDSKDPLESKPDAYAWLRQRLPKPDPARARQINQHLIEEQVREKAAVDIVARRLLGF